MRKSWEKEIERNKNAFVFNHERSSSFRIFYDSEVAIEISDNM